jgi:hyperosmotically inducible protein
MRTCLRTSLTLALLMFGLVWSRPVHAESDAWITTKTKLALWNTEGVHSTRVHVDTNHGVVTVHGKVATQAQQRQAMQVVRGIKGVSEVRDLLQVVAEDDAKGTAASDSDIKRRIEAVLKADASLKGSSVRVKSVDKGVVLLSGKTHTLFDLLTAIEDADSVIGVRQVSSEIHAPEALSEEEVYMPRTPADAKSRLASAMNDMRITTDVKLALLNDPQTPSAQINVDTLRGSVLLFGLVGDEQAKRSAEADAKRVSGVLDVRNELDVVPSESSAGIPVSAAKIKK